MISTAEYELAKYNDGLIKPNIPSAFMLNSTASFIDRIKAFVFKKSHVLVSFDVVSLFTNVPLRETINIVCDYMYSPDAKSHPPLVKETFKKLLLWQLVDISCTGTNCSVR